MDRACRFSGKRLSLRLPPSHRRLLNAGSDLNLVTKTTRLRAHRVTHRIRGASRARLRANGSVLSGAIFMRVFVTGAAGFIGSRLSKSLIARGDEVIGFDNLNDYYPLAHKERHLADLLPSKRQFTFVKGDLRDAGQLRELFQQHKPDAV